MSSFTINDDVTLTSSASIDNVRISGNTISSTDTDGHIILTPNGNGNVGIGTSTPRTSLHVGDVVDNSYYAGTAGNIMEVYGTASTVPPGYSNGDNTATFFVSSTTDYARNVGASIGLGGRSYPWGGGSKPHIMYAKISGVQDHSLDNYYGHFVIETMGNNGQMREKFRITGDGNVGIGTTSPAQTLDIDGTIAHKGLVLSEGTTPNVDEIKTFALHLEPNTSTWINTGIQSTSLATGTYIVEVYSYSTASANTGYLEFYDMRFSGIMSWISNTSGVSVDYNEILLHSTGRANGGNVIYLRTASSGGILVLQMKTSTRNTSFNPANPSYNNFTFKFRRMI